MIFQAMVEDFVQKSKNCATEELEELEIVDSEGFSVIEKNFSENNFIVKLCHEFNKIGKINLLQTANEIESKLYPSFITLSEQNPSILHEIYKKQLQVCLMMENSFIS